jgi:hypothetical protein
MRLTNNEYMVDLPERTDPTLQVVEDEEEAPGKLSARRLAKVVSECVLPSADGTARLGDGLGMTGRIPMWCKIESSIRCSFFCSSRTSCICSCRTVVLFSRAVMRACISDSEGVPK